MKFRPLIKLLILLSLLSPAANCFSNKDPDLENKYKVGSLYSVLAPGQENGFNIVKVLSITTGVVHVRLYKNKFPTRGDAAGAASDTLSLGGIDDPEGFGLKHLPMDKETFGKLEPQFIRQESVSEEEKASIGN
ncbi:MAG TPA: hypothetical protein VGO50_18650 [Pyrinomonadaceae bacterium]|jgi:hypothetical protein|nr:hypothetical protein [Pyrinomonadaceae bacterium]